MKQTINKKEMEVPKGDAESLPKGWEVKSIKDITDKIGDGIHSTPIYSDQGEIYFINGNNLKNGEIIIDKATKTITTEESKKHERGLNNRSILMSINGTIGSLAYYRGEKITLGKSACYLNISDDVNLSYIYHQLSSSIIQNSFLKRLTGSTIMNLGLGEIRKTKLPLPPLPEQKAIAQVLTTADKNIALTDRLIEQKEKQKKWLMQMLLTGKKRLDGFSGEWKEVKLGEISKKKSSSLQSNKLTEDSGKFPVYGATGFITCIDSYEEEEPYIGIVKDGSGVGNMYFLEGKSSVLGTLDMIKTRKSNLYFLFGLLHYINFEKYKVGGAIPHIYYKDYSKEKVLVPTLEEQTAIAEILQTADKEIELLKAKAEQLRLQKKWLMQVLLTGKKRIRN